MWINAAEGFLIVYSITDIGTFWSVKSYYNDIMRYQSHFRGRLGITIVGNHHERERDRIVTTVEGLALAKELGCGFVETCADSVADVEGAFYNVIRRTGKHRFCVQNQGPGVKNASS
jgi:GTPase KRas protein